MSLLETVNLTHRFPDGTIGIREVNLSIDRGEFILLAGKNGSGKTVLMKHLNGLLKPTSGKVLFKGRPLSENLFLARQKVGLVFQEPDNQFVGQTVEEDIAFGPENLGLTREEIEIRVARPLEITGLSRLAKRNPHLLSGGEKRKLAIAGVLAMEPDVVILDEPFASLDYPGVKQISEQILKLHESGHTVLVLTHDIEKMLAHATRLIIMEGGRIMRDGKPFDFIDELEQFGIRKPEAYTWMS